MICERLLILCRANGDVDTFNYDLDEQQLPFTRFFFVAQFDRENERRLPYKWTNDQSPSAELIEKDGTRADDLNNANIEELGFQMDIRSALVCNPSHVSILSSFYHLTDIDRSTSITSIHHPRLVINSLKITRSF